MTVMASLLLKVYRTLAHTRFTTVASLALRAHALSGGFTVRPSPYLPPPGTEHLPPTCAHVSPPPLSPHHRHRSSNVLQLSVRVSFICITLHIIADILGASGGRRRAWCVAGVGDRAGAAWRRFPYLLSLVLRLYFMVEGEGWCRLCPAILSLIGV